MYDHETYRNVFCNFFVNRLISKHFQALGRPGDDSPCEVDVLIPTDQSHISFARIKFLLQTLMDHTKKKSHHVLT